MTEATIIPLIDARQDRFARKVVGMLHDGRIDDAMREILALTEQTKRIAAARSEQQEGPPAPKD